MTDFVHAVQWSELIRSRALAAGLGLFSHFIFNRGEWETYTHIIVLVWTVAFSSITAAAYFLDPSVQSIYQAFIISSTAAAVYLATLTTSILLYRAFFHRLHKFPGPFLARLSKLNSIRLVAPHFQYYNVVEKLHKDYKSNIIRTGPRELSIIDPDAIPLIHGPTSKCTKGTWYGVFHFVEGASLQTTRDKMEHRERRKAWDRAFNAKSLRDYEPRINRHTLVLMERLKEKSQNPKVRISDWVNFYSFDVMGDIGFSRSFGMLEKGQEDALIAMLHASMAPVSVVTHLSWLLSLVLHTGAARDILTFIAWGGSVLKERKKITPAENDVFSWLLDPNDEEIPLQLNSDARLMLVAGSDTTSATLTWLFYELCKNPDVQAKLRKTIDEIAPQKSFLDADDLANCPYLDGVINEALRLHPAVPSGVQRETPPEGLTLPNGTYIPGNTIVWMPVHTMQRDPSSFPSPLTFTPERWTSESPHLIADKRAFLPFSTGTYNCVGQKLSIMEMRCMVANMSRRFEVEFAEGEDGRSMEKDTKDCFTLNVGKLDVKLTPRR